MRKFIYVSCFAILLTGCCSTPPLIQEPQKITLSDAMDELLTQIKKLQNPDESKLKTGLIPSEASIIFNISAKETSGNKLYVEFGAPSTAPVSGKLGDEFNKTAEANRGNQITIKFTNFLLADGKAIINNPENIQKVVDALKKTGINTFSVKSKSDETQLKKLLEATLPNNK